MPQTTAHTVKRSIRIDHPNDSFLRKEAARRQRTYGKVMNAVLRIGITTITDARGEEQEPPDDIPPPSPTPKRPEPEVREPEDIQPVEPEPVGDLQPQAADPSDDLPPLLV